MSLIYNQLIDQKKTFSLWNSSLVDLRLRLMETFPESTSQGNPSDGNPSPFPYFGNIGAPFLPLWF